MVMALVEAGADVAIAYRGNPDGAKRLADEAFSLGRRAAVAQVRADGYLQLTGRSSELYKSGGELVMPREIEHVVGRLDQVSQAYAIGLVDDRWGEIGCVVVVKSPGAELTEQEVIDHCRLNLARFKVPRRVVFLDASELPITPNGEVQKFRLRWLVPPVSAVQAGTRS